MIVIIPLSSFSQSIKEQYFEECQLDSLNGKPIFTTVDVYPEYEGGIPTLLKDTAKNIRVAKEQKHLGLLPTKVTFTFVIEQRLT